MSKEKKPTSQPNKDPQIRFDRSQFFQNRLSLPQALKDKLTSEGLDFRFLNASEFRKNGNRHQSHWTAYKVADGSAQELGLNGVSPEGLIQVGDLILGVRPKNITRAHKEYLAERNARLDSKAYNRRKAQEMRDLARSHDAVEQTEIHEGYDDSPDIARRGTYRSED